MAEVRFRDVLSISIVAGLMVTTMITFIAIFASGLDDPEIIPSLRVGIVIGVMAATLIAIFGFYRVNEMASSAKDRDAERLEELHRLRVILSPIEGRAPSGMGGWIVTDKVRRDRGVLVVDLQGLDAPSAAAVVERMIERRHDLNRVKIYTGKTDQDVGDGSDLGVRPAVLQRLRIDAERVNWQVIQKSSSVTLRPMGVAPTPKIWATRFAIFVIPMTTVMTLAFRDLAGNGLESQGMAFGAASGILVTSLVSSYRDRSA